jgi:hypothetical protein
VFGDADAHAAQGESCECFFPRSQQDPRQVLLLQFSPAHLWCAPGRGKSRNRAVAEVIIAETGGDMNRFTSAQHFASWPGVCPGHHESAGRTKNTKVRPGNPYRKGALGIVAFGAGVW